MFWPPSWSAVIARAGNNSVHAAVTQPANSLFKGLSTCRGNQCSYHKEQKKHEVALLVVQTKSLLSALDVHSSSYFSESSYWMKAQCTWYGHILLSAGPDTFLSAPFPVLVQSLPPHPPLPATPSNSYVSIPCYNNSASHTLQTFVYNFFLCSAQSCTLFYLLSFVFNTESFFVH